MEWVALGFGLCLLLLAGLGHLGCRRHALMQRRGAELLAAMPAVGPDIRLDELPPAASRMLRHAIGESAKPVRAVRFRAVGQIRPATDGPWLPCEARQTLRVPGGFTWRCKVRGGLMRLTGGDHYLEHHGGVRFWLWGILRVAKADGPDIDRSAAHRALLEAVWFPPALARNESVQWLEGDDETARARLNTDGEQIVVEYKVAPDGRIISLCGERWGDPANKGNPQVLPFGGIMEAEQTVQGYTIPSRFRVGWHFGTEHWAEGEFYRAELKDIEFVE